MPRWLITALILAVAALLVLAVIRASAPRDGETPASTESTDTTAPVETSPATDADVSAPPPAAAPDDSAAASADATQPVVPPTPPRDVPPGTYEPITGLHVVEVTEKQDEPVLGSTADDPSNPYRFEAVFSPWGAGIKHIKLADYRTAVRDGEPYIVQQRLGESINVGTSYRYPMAAYDIVVNAQQLYLYHHRWRLVDADDQAGTLSARFAIELADGDGQPILRITRHWRIEPDSYGIRLAQRFEALSDQPLDVGFTQYGPFDLPAEQGYIGDKRTVHLAYLQPWQSDPNRKTLTDEDFNLARSTVYEQASPVVWPVARDDPALDMMWAAMTNRYFAAAAHAVIDPDNPMRVPLEYSFPRLKRLTWGGPDPAKGNMALQLEARPLRFNVGQGTREHTFSLDLYAGPKLPDILKHSPQYTTIGLDKVIVYNLGGMCAFCTFSWLANGLMWFLALIHGLVFDWGMAIIVLVAIVRTILHPLTKHSQINMMKMSKQMQELKPQLDRIKAKFKDNQQKINEETMKLYREKGVNPAAMGLGCLPMFLQMPIWVALYAMLYFAIELRHSPAFWGVFQAISGDRWMFLADLSSQDAFIPLGAGFTIPLIGIDINAINILPLMMGAVFYFQQKYMTPQQTTQLSDQQAQQQAMMKWMMVLLFPLMLYKAPCGLNLYILASTATGIVESRRVRAHLKDLEERGALFKPKKPGGGGLMQRLMTAAEQRQKMMEQQQQQRSRGKGKGNRK